jgi:radical SAM-linked protein
LRNKVAIRFAIEGDLRFISHHDTMRMFERALSRAQLPIKYSKGFNPRPRLSLPLPRPLGIASRHELLVVELEEPIRPADVLASLQTQMPVGLSLIEAWDLPDKMPRPESVAYALELPDDRQAEVAEKIEQLITASTWPMEREAARPPKTIDLRSFLAEAVINKGLLKWIFLVTLNGSARPAELLSAVGLDPQEWLHRVQRTAVTWQMEQACGDETSNASQP